MHRSYPLAFLLVRGLLCNPNGAYANQSLLIVFEHRINDRCWTKRSSLGNKGFLSTFLDGRCVHVVGKKEFFKIDNLRAKANFLSKLEESRNYIFVGAEPTRKRNNFTYRIRVLTERLTI